MKIVHYSNYHLIFYCKSQIAELPGPSKKRPPLKKQITDDDIQSRLDALKRKI